MRFLRENKKVLFQDILCFLNLYHCYKYFSYSKKNELYCHIRECSNCSKSQKQIWHQAGSNLIPRNWQKIKLKNRKTTKISKQESKRINTQGTAILIFAMIVWVLIFVTFQFAN